MDDFSSAYDGTQLLNNAYEQQSYDVSATSRLNYSQEPERTSFLVQAAPLLERRSDQTRQAHYPAGARTDERQSSSEAIVDHARTMRTYLLDRKHSGSHVSNEEAARLDILTDRLRTLSPRVTKSDTAAIETLVDDLSEMSSKLASIRSTFGLR
jgi:hypothetical protein